MKSYSKVCAFFAFVCLLVTGPVIADESLTDSVVESDPVTIDYLYPERGKAVIGDRIFKLALNLKVYREGQSAAVGRYALKTGQAVTFQSKQVGSLEVIDLITIMNSKSKQTLN